MLALISYPGFLAVLLSHCIPALVSCLKSSAILLSCYMFALAASASLFLPCHASVSYHRIPALLLPQSMFGLPFLLRFSLLRIFILFLLDEP